MGINGFFMEIMDMFMDYKNLSNGVRIIEEEEMNMGLDNFRDCIKKMDIPDSLKNFLLFTFSAQSPARCPFFQMCTHKLAHITRCPLENTNKHVITTLTKNI